MTCKICKPKKIQRTYRYIIENDDNKETYKVIDIKDGFVFSESKTTKGAVIGALVCGVQLKTINFNGHYVPIKECIAVVK